MYKTTSSTNVKVLSSGEDLGEVFGNYEEEINTTKGTNKDYYIYGGDGLAAIYRISGTNTTGNLYYIHKDNLGSFEKVTNSSGTVVDSYSFDAWGNRRDVDDWRYAEDNDVTHLFSRGFTGHEHLDEFGLINMNGRCYDPLIGRILSPDPNLQDPTNMQNYNRYSYCLNNPLKYTDPSGYNFFSNIYNFFSSIDINWGSGNVDDGSLSHFTLSSGLLRYGNYDMFLNGSIGSFFKLIGSTGGSGTGGPLIGDEDYLPNLMCNDNANVDVSVAEVDVDNNSLIRKHIAEIAFNYIKSSDWALYAEKGDFGEGKWKCNLFVYDILKQAGASPGLPNEANSIKDFLGYGPYPPTAGQWADPNFQIPEWRILSPAELPQAGDVVAEAHPEYTNATGHCGIVYEYGSTVSAGEYVILNNNFGFRPGQNVVFRRYIGNGGLLFNLNLY